MTSASTTDRTHIPLLTIEAGKLAPAINLIFLIAEENARALEATEVYPEHLFLTTLALSDEVLTVGAESAGIAEGTKDAESAGIEEITDALTALGIDRQMVRAQMRRIFQTWRERPAQEGASVPLAKEAQDCVTWAAELAVAFHAPQLRPVHVLLGTMRHPRIQPLLVLLFSDCGMVLPAYMTEETGVGYTRAVDQLIHSRIRTQQRVRSPLGTTGRLLSCLERPTLLFADILGFHGVKRQLWSVVECLRKPRQAQSPRCAATCGLLLVGAAGNNRALVARAIAGEAVAPLLYLSLPALVELATVTDRDKAAEVQPQQAARKGRELLRDVFAQARQVSPCLLLLDDLDAIEGVEGTVSMQWRQQLIVEMDARNYHPAMVVVATTARPDQLDPLLLLPGRFDRRVVLDGTVTRALARGAALCPSCEREVSARWKFCAYCGESLATTCSHCGTRLPDVRGARFCPECGKQ